MVNEMKRYLPFILMGCLLLSVLFVPSSDATDPSLYVNGVNMVDADPSAYPAGCTYDASTNTLTLNNANLTEDGGKKGNICEGRNILLNLVITGTNTVTNGSTDDDRAGIYIWGALNVSGTGTLNVTGSNTLQSDGIYVLKDMTMSGSTVNASGTNNDLDVTGNLTMTGGTVNLVNSATCTTLGTINMSNDAALHATATNHIGYSIRADKGLQMTGGSIWGSTDGESQPQWGVNDVLIEGGDANISGGEIRLKGNGSLSVLNGSLNVSGSAVITSEVAGTRNSIFAHSGMSVSGGTIIAKSAGNASGNDANDVYVENGSFRMTGGTLNLSGKGTLSSHGNISVSGGAISASGPDALIRAISSDMDISGGTIEFGSISASQMLVAGENSLNIHNATLDNMEASGTGLYAVEGGTASLGYDSGFIPSYTQDDFSRVMTVVFSLAIPVLAVGLFIFLRSRE